MIFKFSASAMETLNAFKLFAQHMDRAEILHAVSYDIGLSWKNILGEFFKLVKLIEKLIFPPKNHIFIPP